MMLRNLIKTTCLMISLLLVLPQLQASESELAASLAAAGRSAEDTARDAGRQPAKVLAFLGVEPGMTVMDLMASGGWYTEVLSAAVGPEGKVYAHNLPAFLQFRDGMYDKAMTRRLADNRLPNVVRVDAELDQTGIKPFSVDVVITALNFHDIFNRDPDAAVAMLKQLRKLIKANGVLGIIDHRAVKGTDAAKLHRMLEKDAVAAAKRAGYLVSSSEILASGEDDHQQLVFDPAIRGKTDRFLLKLVNIQE
ncbi:MAG: class I SAM-dependent methyltransferase [Pseudomonadales bacterium]|nr:class I SAM-dependent methyltransferase [Pseudomonadales bacterium]